MCSIAVSSNDDMLEISMHNKVKFCDLTHANESSSSLPFDTLYLH